MAGAARQRPRGGAHDESGGYRQNYEPAHGRALEASLVGLGRVRIVECEPPPRARSPPHASVSALLPRRSLFAGGDVSPRPVYRQLAEPDYELDDS